MEFKIDKLDKKQTLASILGLAAAILCIITLFILPLFSATGNLVDTIDDLIEIFENSGIEELEDAADVLEGLVLNPTFIDIGALLKLEDIFAVFEDTEAMGGIYGPFVALLVLFFVVFTYIVPFVIGIWILIKMIPIIKSSLDSLGDKIFVDDLKQKYLKNGISTITRLIVAILIPMIVFPIIVGIASGNKLEQETIILVDGDAETIDDVGDIFDAYDIDSFSNLLTFGIGFYLILIVGALLIVSSILLRGIDLGDETPVEKARLLVRYIREDEHQRKLEGLAVSLMEDIEKS